MKWLGVFLGAFLAVAIPAAAQGNWQPAAGVWYDAPPTANVEVTNDGLLFSGNGAARRSRPVNMDTEGRLSLSFTFDPAMGETESLSWMSVMLTDNPRSLAWVTHPEHRFAMYLRSRGTVHLLSNGVGLPVRWERGPCEPADEYRVRIQFEQRDDGVHVRGSVNGHAFESTMPSQRLVESMFMNVGAHFHEQSTRSVMRDFQMQ